MSHAQSFVVIISMRESEEDGRKRLDIIDYIQNLVLYLLLILGDVLYVFVFRINGIISVLLDEDGVDQAGLQGVVDD